MTEHLERGLIQIYTGPGKGKTTAALGLALRAAGHGLGVYIVQFMKGWPNYGELVSVDWLPTVTLKQFGGPHFVDPSNPKPEDKRMAQDALDHALEIVGAGDHDIVVLDEVNVALDFGLIELQDVLAVLDAKPEHVELILTGRNAHPELVIRAHLVTEMLAIKHPYNADVPARKGIEF